VCVCVCVCVYVYKSLLGKKDSMFKTLKVSSVSQVNAGRFKGPVWGTGCFSTGDKADLGLHSGLPLPVCTCSILCCLLIMLALESLRLGTHPHFCLCFTHPFSSSNSGDNLLLPPPFSCQDRINRWLSPHCFFWPWDIGSWRSAGEIFRTENSKVGSAVERIFT
jgi:hypothetical protein